MAIWYNDKNKFLEFLKRFGLELSKGSDEFKNDYDIVMTACKNNGMALEFASDELKNNKDIVMEAIKNDGGALEFASDNLKDDKDIVLEAIKHSYRALSFASDKLKNDKEIILEAVKHNYKAFEFVSNELKDDRDFVLDIVKIDGNALKFVSKNLQNDREVIFEACKVEINNRAAFLSKFDEYVYRRCVNDACKRSDFGKDLLNAIKTKSLNTFKKDYFYYFQTTLENLKDNSIDFNNCLKAFNIKDLEDSKVIDALVNRFSQYECSKDYNLDELKKEPNELLNIIKSINFNKEIYFCNGNNFSK